ncbi:hypothetical protein [Zobellia roscoffensis]|uniref:hypothetical protein n=1 Tax=Zobellia roscoffensis TaxID=2779508 RepID=UPI00188B2A49|nr:hypothetical protein [Zobellia roscoffensis]
MGYYGLLKGLDLNSVSINELKEIQLSNGVFEQVNRVSLTLDGSPNSISQENSDPVYVPNTALTKEFYDYLLNVYENVLENSLIGFFYMYEEDIQGHDEKETKNIAHSYYREIAQLTIKDKFDVIRIKRSSDGYPIVSRAKKTELFNMRQEVLQENLATQNPIHLNHFLIGDASYFNDSLIAKSPILDEILQFEASRRILTIFNEQFHFETEDSSSIDEIKSETIPETVEKPIKKKKRLPLISDKEATTFLIDTVFIKRADKYQNR